MWKQLGMSQNIALQHVNAKKRYGQAITGYHLLAYLMDPHFQNDLERITEEKKCRAMSLAEEEYPDLLTIILQMKAKAYPFNKAFLFDSSVISDLTFCSWWRALKGKMEEIYGLLSGAASSTSVERMFSTFGLVHSKLRNRLGMEKAAKLVFTSQDFKQRYQLRLDNGIDNLCYRPTAYYCVDIFFSLLFIMQCYVVSIITSV